MIGRAAHAVAMRAMALLDPTGRRLLAEIGLTPARTAASLNLPTTTVEADLAAIKRDGHGRSTTGRAA